MPTEKETTTEETIESMFRRSAEFAEFYSNNVYFETSVFDLKATFGHLTRNPAADRRVLVQQQATITMSWLEAKIASIFLAINIAKHEKQFGTVPIPKMVLPPILEEEQGKLPLTKILALIENLPPVSDAVVDPKVNTES